MLLCVSISLLNFLLLYTSFPAKTPLCLSEGAEMLIDETVQLVSVLTATKPAFLPSLTKIVGTLGPKSCSVEVIEACLKAGLSVARFDFSGSNEESHQETLNNLTTAVQNAQKLCAVMLDTVGPELQVCNKTGNPIELKADDRVMITPDLSKEPSADILPVNHAEIAEAVKKGGTIFIGQYLFTGSETTSVWLEVIDTNGKDVICLVKNSATLAGFIFTLRVAQVHIKLPTLSDKDKQVISTWGVRNNVDIMSLSYTRHVEDLRELRAFLATQNLHDTQIFAKLDTIEGLKHFDEILQEADGVILSRGNLGIDIPPEKVFLFQKYAIHRCNLVGKPVIITRVVDSMTGNLRPTRAEATDVANAVLDGADGILLGAETFRGFYPVETIKTVGRICAEAESVYNHALQFKKTTKYVGEPMPEAESVASSAVHTAIKVKAAVIVSFTSSGRAARLIAKYRPTMPVLAVVIPRLRTSSLKWSFSGTSQARQSLAVRGVYPIMANPNMAGSVTSSGEAGLAVALSYGKTVGLVKPKDRVVVFQKIGDSAGVEIIEVPD